MKRKSTKVPEGYNTMKERPADREVHKPHKVTMVWVQNRKTIDAPTNKMKKLH